MTRVRPSTYGRLGDRFDELFDDVGRLTALEGETLDALLRPHGVRRVLDCAAGTGIQALALAALGYDVAASDISPRMLAALSRKASAAGLTIAMRRADFRRLGSWPDRRFDAVICSGGSITLVAEESAIRDAVEGMVRLAAGGTGQVVIGLHDYAFERDLGREFVLRRSWSSSSDLVAFDTRVFGVDHVTVTHTLVRRRGTGWRTMSSANTHRYAAPGDLGALLLAFGCRSVGYFDLAGRPQTAPAEWVLVVGNP